MMTKHVNKSIAVCLRLQNSNLVSGLLIRQNQMKKFPIDQQIYHNRSEAEGEWMKIEDIYAKT